MSTLLLSVDGNIGSGKSTLINLLKEYFKNNPNVIVIQEPVDIWKTIKDEKGKSIIEHLYTDPIKMLLVSNDGIYISFEYFKRKP